MTGAVSLKASGAAVLAWHRACLPRAYDGYKGAVLITLRLTPCATWAIFGGRLAVEAASGGCCEPSRGG